MVLVGAGTFPFGSEDEPVLLPAFYIDVTLTTNADYARFVAATGHRRPPHWSSGRFPDKLAEHPVVHVTHRDATAYAQWAGKALPTETQWEKAARGEKGYIYPWGNRPTAAKCNVRESGIETTTPVQCYRSGVSPYGVYDLSGNVWEWCGTETLPGRFVLRGSAFSSPFESASAVATNDASADMRDDDTGFRCAVPADVLDATVPDATNE
jgi:formylglycine-generating enzyme required for sulfatase activity